MDNYEHIKIHTPKIIIYTVCAVVILIALLISFISFGWFTNSKTAGDGINGMNATGCKFELATAGTSGKYDNYITASDGQAPEGEINGLPTGNVTVTGSGGTEIKWLLSSESNFGNNAESAADGIQPGSYGKLTFYVVAKQSTDLKLTISLDTVLYTKDAQPIDENNDNSAYIIPANSSEAKLTKGHILFFKNKTNGVYSDMITDKFTFEKLGAKKDTAYKTDIYWIWPEVIDQLILPESDSLFGGKDYQKIISDADTQTLITEMSANSECYFADNSIADLGLMLDNISKGSADGSFDSGYYNKLNLKWNESDQFIGTNVGYIELKLTADDTSLGNA